METTLRMFYARALFFVALVFLIFMAVFAGVASAQEAAPISVDEIAAPVAEPEATTQDILSLVFSTAAAGAMSIGAVLMAVLARFLPRWLMGVVEWFWTSEADRWERLVTNGLDRAESYARSQFDVGKDRAGFVNAMAMFLAKYNREIVQWADKDGDGIIDLIQTRLPPAPNAPQPKAEALKSQPLMAATPLRRKREAVQ